MKTHGKRSTYLAGCHCPPCVTAHSTYTKRYKFQTYRAGGKIRVDSSRAQSHVEHLASRMSLTAIGVAAGLSHSTIRRVLLREHLTINRRVERAILSVNADGATGTHWVSPVGAARRVQALHSIGWSSEAIVTILNGYGRRNLDMLVHGRRGAITAALHERIRSVYDELAMTPPPVTNRFERASVTKVTGRARRMGWVPPLAWDDDTIDDPNAQPYTETAERRIEPEDVEFVLSHDPLTTARQLAERFGCTPDGIQHACRRAGRTDLLAKLARNAGLASRERAEAS